jgi:phasin family protein
MSVAGVQALLERRIDTLREALSELRAVSKLMRHAGARETVAHVDELARGAVQLTLASVREMAALASSTQREALAVLARRLQADLLEFRQMQSTLRQRPPSDRANVPSRRLAKCTSRICRSAAIHRMK